MWTPRALASETRAWSGDLWRVVESQSQVATLKLVDTLDEQTILEAELEGSKPIVPATCAGLDYLLATPFRYAPYPHGSRFRRARQPDGCFYASERVETAVAEEAFYRLLFFLDAPGAKRPGNPQERTAFRVPAETGRAIDLTCSPFVSETAIWTHPTECTVHAKPLLTPRARPRSKLSVTARCAIRAAATTLPYCRRRLSERHARRSSKLGTSSSATPRCKPFARCPGSHSNSPSRPGRPTPGSQCDFPADDGRFHRTDARISIWLACYWKATKWLSDSGRLPESYHQGSEPQEGHAVAHAPLPLSKVRQP